MHLNLTHNTCIMDYDVNAAEYLIYTFGFYSKVVMKRLRIVKELNVPLAQIKCSNIFFYILDY